MPTGTAGRQPRAAAFFDVDGTITQTTIVHYYAYFRRKEMSPFVGALWIIWFTCKCLYYLVLDKIDRSRLNVIFYRNMVALRGRLEDRLKSMAPSGRA